MRSSLRKILASVMIVCMLVAIIPCQVFAAGKTGWRKHGVGYDGDPDYRYYTTSTKYVKGWKKIGGSWYWFDSKGIMARQYYEDSDIGEYKIDGKHYFFQHNGKLITSSWIYLGADHEYTYVTKSGASISKGLHKIKGKYYYFLASDWVSIRFDKLCYGWVNKDYTESGKGVCDCKGRLFMENGKAYKGWLYHYTARCEYWCYCDAKGKPAVGWKKIGGKWYYFKNEYIGMFNAKGSMAYSCTLKINGKKYKFNSKGVCTNP